MSNTILNERVIGFFFTVFPSLDLCYTEDTKANVTVLDLKDVYDKGQSRRKANSEQRLLKADVRLKATAQKQIQVFIVNNGKQPLFTVCSNYSIKDSGVEKIADVPWSRIPACERQTSWPF